MARIRAFIGGFTNAFGVYKIDSPLYGQGVIFRSVMRKRQALVGESIKRIDEKSRDRKKNRRY